MRENIYKSPIMTIIFFVYTFYEKLKNQTKSDVEWCAFLALALGGVIFFSIKTIQTIQMHH